MALATKDQAETSALLKWVQSYVGESEQRPPRGAIIPFQTPYSFAAAEVDNSDDRVRLLWFPAGFTVWAGSLHFIDAVDAHATPTLVWDLITESAAGVADTRKLISGSTAGRAAGATANLHAGGVGVYVGERFLVFDPTTAAATAAAGDAVLSLQITRGVATNQLPAITLDAV